MTAANALLTAVYQRLSGDAALVALVGPEGIRDRWLARARLPCVVFGEIETRDFSTSAEAGEEHFLTLEIWSEADGRRQGQEIAGRLQALLHDAAFALEGAVLVSLLRMSARTLRDAKTKLFLTDMRFRAVTE
jgi:hypothetical protein